MGSLGPYVVNWNDADMCEVTSGVSWDRQPIPDLSGPPTSLVQKMQRLKKVVQEVDLAWFDADKTLTVITFLLFRFSQSNHSP